MILKLFALLLILFLYVEVDNVRIAQLLLDAGVNIHAQDDNGQTALISGICFILPFMCNFVNFLNFLSTIIIIKLSLAISRKKLDVADFLVDKGISVNSKDHHGMSPLCYALGIAFFFIHRFQQLKINLETRFSNEDKLRLVKLLIRNGANVTYKEIDCST